MTGYGRGESHFDEMIFTAEVRSVNSRFRDIILRIPRSLQELEEEIRSHIASRVKRGRVEIQMKMEKNGDSAEYELELNRQLVRSYLRIFQQLHDEFGIHQKLEAEYFCQLKDIIVMKPEEVDIEGLRETVGEAVEQALDSLDVMRGQEGRVIGSDFVGRLERINAHFDGIEERTPLVIEHYRKRLRDKMGEITLKGELDADRIGQEVALFADRCDITEEILRGRSHLKQFRDYMKMDDAVGRRLEFLLQEINREVNTIGSKANDSTISAQVVEIKAELEKLREQIQNVE
jgi:uncharacterized protein (TIGR00255 family)